MEHLDKAKIREIVKSKPQLKVLEDTEVDWFIQSAIDKALNLKFPFNPNAVAEDIDYPFYQRWVVASTIAMIENIGIGNIRSYSENGLSISYHAMTDGIPQTQIDLIVPMAGVAR